MRAYVCASKGIAHACIVLEPAQDARENSITPVCSVTGDVFGRDELVVFKDIISIINFFGIYTNVLIVENVFDI